MEELNTAANTNEVADIQEELLITDNDNQTVETQPVEETQETPVGAENTKQEDVSTTKAFSKRLNEKVAEEREKIKAELTKEYDGYSSLLNAIKGLGFEGTPQEIAMRIQAEQKGVDYEEFKAQEEAKQKQLNDLIENDERVVRAKQIEMENQLRVDLESIKKVYPDVTVDKIEIKDGKCNLGDTFLQLMLTGKVDAVTAYAAQLQIDGLTKKEPPKSMGDVKSGNTDVEKDFETEEEFAKYIAKHPEYLDDPKKVDKMFKKMFKW